MEEELLLVVVLGKSQMWFFLLDELCSTIHVLSIGVKKEKYMYKYGPVETFSLQCELFFMVTCVRECV